MKENRSDHPEEAEQQQDAMEATNDFWIISGNFVNRHHVQEMTELHVPQESSLPFPLNYDDVVQRTSIAMDFLREHEIDDYWNVEGDRKMSKPWTRFTPFITTEKSYANPNLLNMKKAFSKKKHPTKHVEGLGLVFYWLCLY